MEPRDDRPAWLRTAVDASTVHPALDRLHGDLAEVWSSSRGLVHAYRGMEERRDAKGLPRDEEYPDGWTRPELSPNSDDRARVRVLTTKRRTLWTEAIESWRIAFDYWTKSIVDARESLRSESVAAILDDPRSPPQERWTARAAVHLDGLLAECHWFTIAGTDGLGVVRAGLPPLFDGMPARLDAIARMLAELRSVPVETPTAIHRQRETKQPTAEDDVYRPATWFPKGMAARLRKAASKSRQTKRVRSKKLGGVVCYSVADARLWWPKDVPNDP